MKRFVIISSVLLLYTVVVMAQTDSLFIKKAPKLKFGLSTQSQYAMFGNNGNAWGNYLIPSMSYNTNKWHFDGALALGNTQYNGSMFAGMNQPTIQTSPVNNVSFYGRGVYHFNSKFSINTVVYRDANSSFMPMANARALDFSSAGAGLGFSYKLNDNVRFDLGFQFRKGNNPYYSRYGNSLYNNGLFSNSLYGGNSLFGYDGF